MSRFTVDLSGQLDSMLDNLAQDKGTTKAEVLRRALASYAYINQEAEKVGGQQTVVSIKSNGQPVGSDILLP